MNSRRVRSFIAETPSRVVPLGRMPQERTARLRGRWTGTTAHPPGPLAYALHPEISGLENQACLRGWRILANSSNGNAALVCFGWLRCAFGGAMPDSAA